MFTMSTPPVVREALGSPEHVLSEWLVADVPDLSAALDLIDQLESSGARDTEAELFSGKVRVRWRW